MLWIAELEPGVFVAPDDGGVNRTIKKYNARIFSTINPARCAIKRARKVTGKEFKNARVIEVNN